eukprot:NODE_477_length_7951_cov_0.254075.p2 type:complete len:225 gc:universal NODE_477_length_7951_cov_0.254075:973-299(-)
MIFSSLLSALDCGNIVVSDFKFDISALGSSFEKSINGTTLHMKFKFNPCQILSECHGYACLGYSLDSEFKFDVFSNEEPSISYENSPERLVLRYKQIIANEDHLATIRIGHSDKDSNYVSVSEDYSLAVKKTILAEYLSDKIIISKKDAAIEASGGLGWFSIVLIVILCYFILMCMYRFLVLKDTGINVIPHLGLFKRIVYYIEDGFHWIRNRFNTSGGQYMQL